jgi:hypothetical protein
MRNISLRKSIYSLIITFLLACFAFILIQLNASRPVSIIKALNLQYGLSQPARDIAFKANFFGFLGLAEAELRDRGEELYEGRKVYHLEGVARATKFISWFYNAYAEIDSVVDKNKLHSLRFTQTLVFPDKPKEVRTLFYDQENNIMELRGVKRNILPDTQDPLSAMYYIQRQELAPGKEFDININTNNKNYRLYIKVIKKEGYVIGGKKTGAWVLQGDIRRRDKSPRHSSAITLWVLDGPYKIPFLMKIISSAGPVTARLVKVQ